MALKQAKTDMKRCPVCGRRTYDTEKGCTDKHCPCFNMTWEDYVKTHSLEQYEQDKIDAYNRIETILSNYEWIPVSSGLLPDELKSVQVTYVLGYFSPRPYCNKFAYIENGEWYWAHNAEKVDVTITAWKPNCEPYVGGDNK